MEKYVERTGARRLGDKTRDIKKILMLFILNQFEILISRNASEGYRRV